MAYIERYLVILYGIQKIHNSETYKPYSWGGKIWLTHYKERKKFVCRYAQIRPVVVSYVCTKFVCITQK